MEMMLCLFITAWLVWLVLYRFRRRNMYRLAAKLPSPKGELPIIGTAHWSFGSTEDTWMKIEDLTYQAIQHNGLLKFWICHKLLFVMVDPADLEYVLKACLEKSNFHKFTRTFTGNGSVFAPVPIWRGRRRVLVPVFSPKILENFVSIFSKQSEKLTRILEHHADGGKVAMWPFVNAYTFDSVCETTTGVQMNVQGDPNSQYLWAMNRGLHLICQRAYQLWLQPDWLYKLFPHFSEYEACKKVLNDFMDGVIKSKIKEMDIHTEKPASLNDSKASTFLHFLLKPPGTNNLEGLTDEEAREEIMTLVFAGTDTSAVAIGFTIVLLAKYPDLQERAYQEINSIFGDSDRPIEKTDLLELKYLERFLKESLRLFPPVPCILREVENDVTLPSGRKLPAGGVIVASIWGAHRDPKYWGPDAEHFDPDRFLPGRFNLEHPCSFMPFSQGPRNCVGYQYAMMSMKTALTAILRRFKIVGEVESSPIPKIRVKLDIMMKAVDNYTVALERRKPLNDI